MNKQLFTSDCRSSFSRICSFTSSDNADEMTSLPVISSFFSRDEAFFLSSARRVSNERIRFLNCSWKQKQKQH